MVVVELFSYGRSRGRPPGKWQTVWDLERLPNARRELTMRYTGLSARLRAEVLSYPQARAAVAAAYANVLAHLSAARRTPRRRRPRRLRFAFGCYRGFHRSVSVVECLAENLRRRGIYVCVVHYDIIWTRPKLRCR